MSKNNVKTNEKPKTKTLKMPSSYTIILGIIIFIAILTWIIPSVTSAGISDILLAPIDGFKGSVAIILFILIIGGFLKVVEKSGALEAGIAKVVSKTKGKEIILIPILMFIFSLGGTTYGMAEETLAFYPLVVGTMLACGYDVLTGTATILCGVLSGVSGATINPFSIGTAVDALKTGAEVDANQTIVIILGALVWLSSYAISCFFTMRYAKRVQKKPELSCMTEEEKIAGKEQFYNENLNAGEVKFTTKQKITLILFGISFLIMIISLIPWTTYGITIFDGWSSFLTGASLGDWYFSELSAWFLLMAIIVGLINGMKEKEIANAIVKGAGELMGVALIVGLSKGVSVLMSSTGFDVYLLEVGTNAMQGMPSALYAVMSYAFYNLFSVLIPSTSGLAAATIPTMGGLSASLGFAPEVMISTYVGAHFIVGVIPTSGTVMSSLSVSKIEYGTWLKFYGKIFAVITVVNLVLFTIATSIL